MSAVEDEKRDTGLLERADALLDVLRLTDALPPLPHKDLEAPTFKSLFDRPKDWLDIASMVDSDAIDPTVTAEELESLIGPDDHRVVRLRALGRPMGPT